MKIKEVKMIDYEDWNELVEKIYERPYHFQQQDGCRDRGTFDLTVPDENADDFLNKTVPENVNDPKMGVSFEAWLSRNPKRKLKNKNDQADYCLTMWWQRNFYPNINMVANDLYKKGLLPAGTYIIVIDW